MAGSANVAFSRYLRTLREDRGLTLRRACELSTESSPIDKAALSRFERGQQGATLSMLIPLAHIYRVPSDALIERFEADSEMDRVGAPETEGKCYADLLEAGRNALVRQGLKWEAYGFWREALERAGIDPPLPGYTEEQQRAVARLNLATVARSLGKNRYALFELTRLVHDGDLPPGLNAVALDRIANCYRCLGEYEIAESFIDDAIAEALRLEDRQPLAFAYFSRASNILDQSMDEQGVEYLKLAFRADREAGEHSVLRSSPALGVSTLIKLADVYYQTARYEKAGRAALAARDLSRRAGVASGEAYSEVLLGLVDESRGRHDSAVRRWRRVGRLAKRMHNTRLAFFAEFYVFRQAVKRAHHALARASRQRLERLAPWVPSFLPQLQQFRAMTTDHPIDPQAAVRQVSPKGE